MWWVGVALLSPTAPPHLHSPPRSPQPSSGHSPLPTPAPGQRQALGASAPHADSWLRLGPEQGHPQPSSSIGPVFGGSQQAGGSAAIALPGPAREQGPEGQGVGTAHGAPTT